jgi:molybdopterin-binding protein
MPNACSGVSVQPSLCGAAWMRPAGRDGGIAASGESNQTAADVAIGDCQTVGPQVPRPHGETGEPYREVLVKLSARNKLDGTVTSIHKGEAIANVVIDVGGQRLVASITVEAVDELGLNEGTAVTAIVKASDVIVATGD